MSITIAGTRVRLGRAAALLAALIATAPQAACEDPSRPMPDAAGATLFVDSDPQGGRILIDGEDTGERTPAVLGQLAAGARRVHVELDTAGLLYTWSALVVVGPDLEPTAAGPLTIRCSNGLCLRNASSFHSAGNLRFAVNAAGPLLLHEGLDLAVIWPSSTSNSYSPLGTATFTALIGTRPVALGLRNAGTISNYWAGRPIPSTISAAPYRVAVPAWITPPSPITHAIRGLEVVQEAIVSADQPDVLAIRVTWRNITTDSLYRLLDPVMPVEGITYTDAYVGFILDPDIGAFGESDDDLVSYDADRGLVFAYDSDFQVTGFSGGWSDRPGLIGLMMLQGPGASVRLNAWPRTMDFAAGSGDDAGRVLLTAAQTNPSNHPDVRIGYAPDTEAGDYIVSVANGPITLAPGESVTASFALLLAAPVTGTFQSGQLLPAGDPVDAERALAAAANRLIELADSLISGPVEAIGD